MSDIKEDILRAARKAGVSVSEVSTEQSGELRKRVITKFAGNKPSSRIWETMSSAASVQDPDSWLWITDYVQGKPVILFFDEQADAAMFSFNDGSQIIPVLSDCPLFEFYVADPALTYLICFNHHDFLIADGAAADWLMAKRDESQTTTAISGGTTE